MYTNEGLVVFAKRALAEKWGYVWGTFGKVLTPDEFAAKVRQYPQGVGNYFDFIKNNWVGRRTVDCVGLIKAYYWDTGVNYAGASDASADSMLDIATIKGSIATMPDIPGLCVCKPGHIGVYIGEGKVIEAHGTVFGVIETPLKGGTPWTNWCKCPYINYTSTTPSKPSTSPKGSAESPSALLQRALNAGGFKNNDGHSLIIDGDLGINSMEALSRVALGPGSVNPVIGWFQTMVHIGIDNNYANPNTPPHYRETYDAVGRQQMNKHLNNDYVIGKNTLLSCL